MCHLTEALLTAIPTCCGLCAAVVEGAFDAGGTYRCIYTEIITVDGRHLIYELTEGHAHDGGLLGGLTCNYLIAEGVYIKGCEDVLYITERSGLRGADDMGAAAVLCDAEALVDAIDGGYFGLVGHHKESPDGEVLIGVQLLEGICYHILLEGCVIDVFLIA